MALDLGALVAGVFLDTAQFDRSYARVIQQMAQLGADATKAAGGTTALDDGLIGVGNAAERATVTLGEAARAAGANATVEERAAQVAARHAEAMAAVAGTMNEVAATTPRVQAATLRVVAAQERLNAVQESGTATTRQLASAQATLISANRSLAAAEEEAAAAGGRFSFAFGGLLKTAAELGLVIGGIEIARKAVEFVMAGKELTTALNGVQAASRATNAQMKAVRAEAIALGKDLTVPAATAVDAAQAIEDLVKAGVALPRALVAARPALLLAAAANVSTADSARVLGDVLDEFQLPAEKAGQVANYLAAGANAAGGGLMSMFEAFTYIGPRGRAVGLGVDDIAAAITDLAKAGIVGDRAGTGLAMMLQKLSHETPAADHALRMLGVTAWDAQGRFVGLPKVIDELHAAQLRLNPKEFLAAISTAFGARAANVVTAFAGKGVESYNRYLAVIKSGDVQKYADLMNRGVGAGFRQLGKEATAAGIDLYQKLEPHLATTVMWLGVNLPKAIRQAKADLSPLEHMVGGALTAAWHLFSGAVQVAATVLGPVLHLIEDIKTPLSTAALLVGGLYLGFKLFSAIPSLIEAVSVKMLATQTAVVGLGTKTRTMATDFTASWAAIGTSAKVGAATATAAMSDIELEAAAMSGTVVAEGEAATVGWAGLLGPLGAAAVGIGLLVTLFHHSSSASKEATDAAKAYSAALKTGDPAELQSSIVEQLANNDVPAKIDKLNKSLGATKFSGAQFVSAIQSGNPALNALRRNLEAVMDADNKALHNTSNSGAAKLNAQWETANSLLQHLNTEYATLTKEQVKEIANYKALKMVAAPVEQIASSIHLTSAEVKAYAGMLGLAVTKSGDLVNATAANQARIKALGNDYDIATQSADGFLGALATFSQSAGTAADRAALIGATLKDANGDALSYVGVMATATAANAALTDAFKQQSQQLASQSKDQSNALKAVGVAQQRVNEIKADAHHKDSTLAAAEDALTKAQQKAGQAGALAYADTERAALKFSTTTKGLTTASIDYTRKGAAPLIQQLQAIQDAAMQAAEATYQHNVATEGGKKAADDAYNVYVSQTRSSLIAQAAQLGLNTKQATALANAYFGIKGDVKTTIESEGANPVLTVLNQIGALLADLTGKKWTPVLDADQIKAQAAALAAWMKAHPISLVLGTGAANKNRSDRTDRGFANGTPSAPAGTYWVGEEGPELMDFRGGERVTNHRDSMRAAKSIESSPQTIKHQTINLTVNNPVGETVKESFALSQNRAENLLD